MSENKQTWANLIRPDNPPQEKEGPSTWDKVASGLSSVGNFASGFAADAIHAGTSEFVERVMHHNPGYSHDPAKEREQEPDKDKEKDKDQGLDR